MTVAHYDLAVIGAGIHGAGVGQSAVANGYSTLILEQSQIAAGTSSRSSKLIHGGLRYLEHGELGLVRECLAERAILLKNAPELVKLQPFHIPVYKHSKRRAWQLRTGLSIYSLLGEANAGRRFQRIPKSEWSTLDGLETRGLKRVFRYQDAQTDDVALTQAVVDSALALDATLRMPATVTRVRIEDDLVRLWYDEKGIQQECTATTLVNAAGPWVNQVLSTVTPITPQLQIRLVQGTHILLDGQLNSGLYYLESPSDGRPVFVMPWRDQTMVGTTEIDYIGDPAKVSARVDEKTYLLEVLSYYFPHYRSEETARVASSFSGLRVLPNQNSSPAALPRDTVLHVDNEKRPRLLSIYGGKLTAYRATAEKAINKLRKSLPERTPKADTKNLPLKLRT